MVIAETNGDPGPGRKYASWGKWVEDAIVPLFHDMMTSSNGDIFRVTGLLCGEFTGLRWIPLTKASDAELWCFFFICARINGWVNNGEADDLRRYRAHYDVTVMMYTCVHNILGLLIDNDRYTFGNTNEWQLW